METLSPNIFVKDINKTIAFYETLGFKIIASKPEGESNIDWVMMGYESVTFMFQTYESLGNLLPQIKRENGSSLLFFIKLKDIRGFFDRIKNKVKVIQELNKTFYGATEFSIVDNNEYVLTFAEWVQ